jgi:hypothetical protein
MQWGESETSPSLGIISLKKILVFDRDIPALATAAVVLLVLLVQLRYSLVQGRGGVQWGDSTSPSLGVISFKISFHREVRMPSDT